MTGRAVRFLVVLNMSGRRVFIQDPPTQTVMGMTVFRRSHANPGRFTRERAEAIACAYREARPDGTTPVVERAS